MSVSEHDSLNQAERALIFTPDINDPTVDRVAISREMASEQVRLIADPAPLGLGAFALTTFLLSLANAGVMPAKAEPIVFGLALAYGGIAQILAGMWEVRKSNVFGATAFTSYGAFWVSFWAYVTFYAPEVPAELHGAAAGWFLISWGIFTTLMLVAALRTTAVLALLFAVLAAGALGELSQVGGEVAAASGAAERLFEILAITPAIEAR